MTRLLANYQSRLRREAPFFFRAVIFAACLRHGILCGSVMRSSLSRLHVIVLGLRGIPDVQGGIEKHVEKLCPLLQQMGCDFEVMVRAPYARHPDSTWKGIRLLRIWCPKSRSCEAIHSHLFWRARRRSEAA